MKLSPQEKKVYEYIKAHPGCTTHDITRDTFVQKPCARIVGLEQKGVVVERRGQIKYPGTRPFEKLYIGKPLTRKNIEPVFNGDGTVTLTEKLIEV